MSLYDTYVKQKEESSKGTSIYSQYLAKNQPKQSGLKGLLDSVVVKPITAMSEVFREPQTPKSWSTAFHSPAVAQKAWETWTATFDDTSLRLNRMMDAYRRPDYSGRFLLNAGLRTTEAGVGLVNSAFAGVSGLINSLTVVPGVGHLADGVNKLFGAVGVGASSMAVDALRAMPGLEEDTKTKLEPVVGELASLVGMVLAGKATHSTITDIKTRSSTVFETIKQKVNPTRNLPVSGSPGETRIRISTPASRYAEYRRSQGYEPYTPDAELPTIDFGARPRTTEPTIQLEPRSSSIGPTYAPVPEFSENRPELIPNGLALRAVVVKTPVSKTSRDAQRRAGALGMPVPDTNLGRFTPMNMRDQQVTADAIATDTRRAERILSGAEPLPPNVERGSLYRALEQRAYSTMDVPLINRLSRLGAGSAEAQALKAYDRPLTMSVSPVDAIQEIRDARLENARRVQPLLDVAKETAVIKKKSPAPKVTRQSWDDFVNQLEC